MFELTSMDWYTGGVLTFGKFAPVQVRGLLVAPTCVWTLTPRVPPIPTSRGPQKTDVHDDTSILINFMGSTSR